MHASFPFKATQRRISPSRAITPNASNFSAACVSQWVGRPAAVRVRTSRKRPPALAERPLQRRERTPETTSVRASLRAVMSPTQPPVMRNSCGTWCHRPAATMLQAHTSHRMRRRAVRGLVQVGLRLSHNLVGIRGFLHAYLCSSTFPQVPSSISGDPEKYVSNQRLCLHASQPSAIAEQP